MRVDTLVSVVVELTEGSDDVHTTRVSAPLRAAPSVNSPLFLARLHIV